MAATRRASCADFPLTSWATTRRFYSAVTWALSASKIAIWPIASNAAIASAAPSLAAAQTTITVKINGVACTTDATCTAAMVAGLSAVVKATYPCNLVVMGVNYAPSGCTLSAQSAQMIQ